MQSRNNFFYTTRRSLPPSAHLRQHNHHIELSESFIRETFMENKQEYALTKVLLRILAQKVSEATQTPVYLSRCRKNDTNNLSL
jgi:hypothetical protein